MFFQDINKSMIDINLEKKRIRGLIKDLKKKHPEGDRLQHSSIIFNQIESLEQFRIAKTILAYWSIPGEVHTHDFILKWHKSKQIVLPVIVGENLEIRLFSDTFSLSESNSFRIMEPQQGKIINPIEIDFAIIPGIAFDGNGNRLGRGKGYYDRLLNQIKGLKVGVCFRFQLFDSVPVVITDIPVNVVITN